MRNIFINHSRNSISVRQNMITLWLYRLELGIYFIVFTVVLFFFYKKSTSTIEVKLGLIGILIIAFLVVIIKKKRSLYGTSFNLTRTKEGVNINNRIMTSKIDIGAIEIKEMVSTYSASGYYDISLKVNNEKIPIAFGVSEKDKKEILEVFSRFLSSEVNGIG